MNIPLYSPDTYSEDADRFLSQYALQCLFICDGRSKAQLKPKQERKCRFCGKAYGETTFKEKAHLIPEMLGNKNLFSDYECDACNQLFSQYEDQLAKFLGIARTLQATKGKKNVPKFKSSDYNLYAQKEVQDGESVISINKLGTDNDTITMDETAKTMFIKYTKQPYVPSKVYKALYKIALSALPDDEVENYKHGFDYLTSELTDIRLHSCLLYGYRLPFNNNLIPHLYLFKKKDPALHAHSHVMIFTFANEVYQFPLPFNKQDYFFYGKQFTLNTCPPLFLRPLNDTYLDPQYFRYDLSSDEVKELEEETIVCKIEKEDWVQMVVRDPNGNIVANPTLDMGDIMKVTISRI